MIELRIPEMTMGFRKSIGKAVTFLIGFTTCLLILSILNEPNMSDTGSRQTEQPEQPERMTMVQMLDENEEREYMQLFKKVDEHVEPAPKPVAKPVAKRVANPVANPVVKPVAKPVAKPAVNPVIESAGRGVSNIKCDKTKYPICNFDPPEDIKTVKLPPFLKNYNNPCWAVDPKTEEAPPIRCLPYFFLAGAPKSGTTDLYERIIKHPQISGNLRKEVHWFSRHHYIPDTNDFRRYPHRPFFRNYTDQFINAANDIYYMVDKKGYHDIIFGDSSVSTFWDNTYAISYADATGEEVAWTPEAIHHLNPKTKFISIVRDPVDRVFSDYLFFDIFPQKSQEGFHNRVKEAIDNHNQCLETQPLRRCISVDKAHVRVWIGIYAGYYQEFFKFFPREQFYIMTMDEYSNDMAGQLAKIYTFLQLDPVTSEQMRIIADESNITNARKAKTLKIGDMLPETKAMLRKFYRPYNNKLVELLGERFNFN